MSQLKHTNRKILTSLGIMEIITEEELHRSYFLRKHRYSKEIRFDEKELSELESRNARIKKAIRFGISMRNKPTQKAKAVYKRLVATMIRESVILRSCAQVQGKNENKKAKNAMEEIWEKERLRIKNGRITNTNVSR